MKACCPVSPHLCFLLCASCPLNAPFTFWNHSFEGGCTAAFHYTHQSDGAAWHNDGHAGSGMKFSIRSSVLPDRVHCGRSSMTRTLCYWPTFRFFFSCRASHVSELCRCNTVISLKWLLFHHLQRICFCSCFGSLPHKMIGNYLKKTSVDTVISGVFICHFTTLGFSAAAPLGGGNSLNKSRK